LGFSDSILHLFYQSFGFIVIIRALWGPFVSGVFGATDFGDSAGLDTTGFGDSAGLGVSGFGDSTGLDTTGFGDSAGLDVSGFGDSADLGISVFGCSGSNLPEINLLHSPKVLSTS
jgi:hypothetical protein